MDDDEHLRNLLIEEQAKLTAATADMSLSALVLLGVYQGKETPFYRLAVSKALCGVLLATNCVVRSIEAVNGDRMMTPEQLAPIVSQHVAALLQVDAKMLLAELQTVEADA